MLDNSGQACNEANGGGAMTDVVDIENPHLLCPLLLI